MLVREQVAERLATGDGRYACPDCTTPYPSAAAAASCDCDED